MKESTCNTLSSIQRIDPKMYQVDLSTTPLDDGTGGESQVYVGAVDGRKVVLKVYALGPPDCCSSTITLEQLVRYQEITQRAISAAPLIRTPFLIGEETHIAWEVTPIEVVGVLGYGLINAPCSVSPFICGPILDEDQKASHLLTNMVGQQGISTGDVPPIMWLLNEVSESLRKLTGERSINLARVNIKPRKREDGYCMVITDLCARVNAILL